MDRFSWWWGKLLPLLLWIGVILWIASRPKTTFIPPDKEVIYGFSRKLIPYLYHLSAFFILATLFHRCSLSTNNREGARKSVVLSFFGSVLVSVCSELVQFYVPTRTPALRDLFIDSFGAILGIIFLQNFLQWRQTDYRVD